MDKKTQIPPNVILLDADFINDTANNAKHILSTRMNRELPPLNLVTWLTCIAMDAGISGTNNPMLVILVCHKNKVLKECVPDSADYLDGKVCPTALGEMSFACVTDEELASSHADFYLDLLSILLNDAEVKRLALIPSPATSEVEIADLIRQSTEEMPEKSAMWFHLNTPGVPPPCTYAQVAGSLAYTWKIQELD